MMGIPLVPFTCLVPEVDIVTKGLLLASLQVRLFPLEPLIFPILIERHRFRYTHEIDEVSLSTSLTAAGTYNPVSYGANLSNSWFTRGQSAYSKKWIGRETIVAGNNIGE